MKTKQDILNYLKSELSEAKKVKLTKKINKDRIAFLEEIINKII